MPCSCQIYLQATNGYVKFDAAAPGLTAGEQTDAAFVLDPANDKSAGGVDWMMGNGSFATELQFLARMSPLGKVRAIQFDR